MKNHLRAALGVLSLLVFWEVAVRLHPTSGILFPPPTTVALAAARLFLSSQWWHAVRSSLGHYGFGTLLGATLGALFGVACAEMRGLHQFFSGIIRLIRPIPPLAWVPLSVLWFGVTSSAAIFIIAIGVFWVAFDGAYSGFSSVDPKFTELARAFRRDSALQRSVEVLIPAALPTLIASTRSALGLGWMLLVASEIVGVPGIGQRMWEGAGLLATDEVMVCMITIAISYTIVDSVVRSLEKRYIWWADG